MVFVPLEPSQATLLCLRLRSLPYLSYSSTVQKVVRDKASSLLCPNTSDEEEVERFCDVDTTKVRQHQKRDSKRNKKA
jgi:hypothetical protein